MDRKSRKRAHEIQTHRLVSSGAGASAVSTNTFRGRPSQPPARRLNRTASGPLARLRTAGKPIFSVRHPQTARVGTTLYTDNTVYSRPQRKRAPLSDEAGRRLT